MDHSKYPSSQWNSATAQQYHPSAYGQENVYHHSSVPVSSSMAPQPLSPAYDGSNVQHMPAYPNYPSHYSSGSSSTNHHYPHSPVSPDLPMTYAQHQPLNHIPRPQSTAPYPSSHSGSYTHSHPHSPSSPYFAEARARSNSQDYDPFPSPILVPQYTEIPIPQTIGISSDYPPSPMRPFSCDICALSFNRQHDLKRHRETHTGEKPYLCNGGCGKTFTRKDALKRHQLVKKCGNDDIF